ncbi:hypothetical protein K1719_037437 [Acacia pycnantha]|nr:hypothetical protein K1719_037437 [Acacia pycnantha]
MCVELDLNKPLVPEFNVEGQILSMVYESLGKICNKCGRVGHMKDACEVFHRRNNEEGMVVDEVDTSKKNDGEKEGEKEIWKTIQRFRRPRKQELTSSKQQSGSHFAVLNGRGVQIQHNKQEKNEGVGGLQKYFEKTRPRSKGPGAQESKREAVSKGKVGVLRPSHVKGGKQLVDTIQCGDINSMVPESNLQAYGGHEVHMVDKEILHLGECIDIARKKDVMGAAAMHFDGKDVMGAVGDVTSKGVAAVIRDFKYRYKLDLAVISEPRISGSHASKVIRSWGFKKSCRMEAGGYLGGIWLLWDLEELSVEVKLEGGDEDAPSKLAILQQDLMRWNKEVFGKLEGRKRQL